MAVRSWLAPGSQEEVGGAPSSLGKGRRHSALTSKATSVPVHIACSASLQLFVLLEGRLLPRDGWEVIVLYDAGGVSRWDEQGAPKLDFGFQAPPTCLLTVCSSLPAPAAQVWTGHSPFVPVGAHSALLLAPLAEAPGPPASGWVSQWGTAAGRVRGERGWGFVTWCPSCGARLRPSRWPSPRTSALGGAPARAACLALQVPLFPLVLVSGCFTIS